MGLWRSGNRCSWCCVSRIGVAVCQNSTDSPYRCNRWDFPDTEERIKPFIFDSEKRKKPLQRSGFLYVQIIPTRRVKSISKLFCIDDLIRRGFI